MVYHVMALACSFFFACISIANKITVQDLPPQLICMLRYSFSFLSLAFFLRINDVMRLKRDHIKQMMLTAVLGIMFNFCFISAMRFTLASTGALIFAIHPILTLFVMAIISRKLPRRMQIAGFIFAFIGVALVITQGKLPTGAGGVGLGELLAFCGVLSQVAYTMVLKRASHNIEPGLLTSVVAFLSALICLPFAAATGALPYLFTCSLTNWFIIFFTAVCFRSLAIYFYTLTVKHIGAPMTSLLVFSTLPVFVIILGFILLKEQITMWHASGAVLVISSLYMALLGDK